MGIMTYMAIPELAAPPPSKLSDLTTRLQSIRENLELYKMHHDWTYPIDIIDGLTKKTDADGTVNKSGQYGPYIQQFPTNPFVSDPVKAVRTNGGPGEGWFYDSTTGTFAANTTEHKDL